MKKELLILVILLLLLNGCGRSSSSTSTTAALTGTEGVRLSFVHNNPPSIVYYDGESDYPVEVEAFNRGTSPTSVTSHFAGFDSSIVSLGDLPDFQFMDEGDSYKTRYNPEGGYEVESEQMSFQQMEEIDTYDFTLKLIYCYDYETKVNIPICVDPSPNKKTNEDACSPGTVSTSGQGAPVGVSSIETYSLPGKVRLKMTVKDYSSGLVLAERTECKGIPERQYEDIVEFTDVSLGDSGENCITESPIRLRNKEATIICTFDIGDTSESAYKTVLSMTLRYMIKDTTEKNIKVVNELE